MCSKIFILWLFFRLGGGLLEEHSSHYLELRFFALFRSAADFQLTLERAVLPVGKRVFIVLGHLEQLVRILVHKLKDVSSHQILALLLAQAPQHPVVVSVKNILTFIPISPMSKG